MTWNDLLRWGTAAAWGLVIGGIYFYGLWWTLRRMPSKAKPRLWLGTSFAVRLTLAMLGFWLVMRRDAVSFFFTMGAFFLIRVVLTRRLAGSEGSRAEIGPGEHAD